MPTGASSGYPEEPELFSANGTRRCSHARADKPATTSQNNRIFGAIFQLGKTSPQAQNGQKTRSVQKFHICDF